MSIYIEKNCHKLVTSMTMQRSICLQVYMWCIYRCISCMCSDCEKSFIVFCISLMLNNIEHLSGCLLVICMKSSHQIFCPFINQVILLPVISPREMKIYAHAKFDAWMFISTLSGIAKSGNNPNVYQLSNKQWYICTIKAIWQ